ncbi:MAG: hypothetical protein FWD64_07915 [Acidobacteriaceae bacterium]|nr:hypothetical protein [Acidobacteriaceae bacterium]
MIQNAAKLIRLQLVVESYFTKLIQRKFFEGFSYRRRLPLLTKTPVKNRKHSVALCRWCQWYLRFATWQQAVLLQKLKKFGLPISTAA